SSTNKNTVCLIPGHDTRPSSPCRPSLCRWLNRRFPKAVNLSPILLLKERKSRLIVSRTLPRPWNSYQRQEEEEGFCLTATPTSLINGKT
ncbi:hypothetical protein Hamer_G026425, partial [Homarus americanus]